MLHVVALDHESAIKTAYTVTKILIRYRRRHHVATSTGYLWVLGICCQNQTCHCTLWTPPGTAKKRKLDWDGYVPHSFGVQ